MDTLSHRRRFLQLTGAGTVASIAGCNRLNGPQDGESNESDPDSEAENESDAADEADVNPDEGVTALVEPDREEIEALQKEAEEEELTQGEVRERQMELIEAAVEEFEARVEDTEDLTIEASMAERGLYFVDGTDEALVETLKTETSDALLPGSVFVQAREQQGGS